MRKHVLMAAIAVLSLPGAATAHEAGQVILRAGVNHIAPASDSSRISVNGARQSGTSMDINSATQTAISATYMFTSYLGFGAHLSGPTTHKVKIKGMSDGTLGEASLLMPIISTQFFFIPKSRFRPYVGLGLNHAMFYNETLTRSQRRHGGFRGLALSDSVGLAGQVGMDYAITNRVLLSASVHKLKTSTTVKTRRYGNKVKADIDIDPWVYFIGAGYRF